MNMTAGEIMATMGETSRALRRADHVLDRLARAQPRHLAALVEPTLRIKERLEAELDQLEALAKEAGV